MQVSESRIDVCDSRLTYHSADLMALIDFILNLAGLLLWVNWRTKPLNPQALMSTRNLMGTLRRADDPSPRRWQLPVLLIALLFLRAVLYWQIGAAINWTGMVNLGVVSLSFRSDWFERMLWFSLLSFAVTLAVFHLCLLLISVLRPRTGDLMAGMHLTRTHLGWVDAWPRGVRLLVPWLAGGLLWWVLTWPLAHWQIIPNPVSGAHRFEQALIVGLGTYVVWPYLIGSLLGLYVLNSYLYFGDHRFWHYVDSSARQLLAPLRALPLRVGKVDGSPLLAMVLVLLLGRLAQAALGRVYAQLPW